MTAEREEIGALEKEGTKLRQANEILKTMSAFFAAAELDHKLR
jgi:transposase